VPPSEISATLNTISQKIIDVLKFENMVLAFEKWIKREHITKVHKMNMTAWGRNNYDFLVEFDDKDVYIGFDSTISGEPKQVYITEMGPGGVKKTILSVECYERLIKIPAGKIVDVAEI
jgi:hypothetical protein